MLVCLTVTGLQLKRTGLGIVYVPVWHMTLMMPLRYDGAEVASRLRTQRIEDDARTSPET